MLFVGASSAWADPIETIGTTSTGWWTAFSNTYSLEGYGTYNFKFTTTNANDGTSYHTWLLIATNGNDSHGGGGTEYFAYRADNYAWGQGTTSTDSDKMYCSSTYSGSNLQAAMNGASVDLTVTRKSTNISLFATVTPTNGDSEFTMSFDYLFGNATSDNIGLFLTVENAQVVLNSSEQTESYTTIWNADFASIPSGMTYSISAGSCNITNGYLWYKNDVGSGDRTQTASFSDSKFNVDTDWIMEFDWNCGQSNQNTSNVTFATNSGNAFTLSWKNNGNGQVTVTDASATELTTTLPVAGYNISSISTWSHIVVTGNKTNGVYLTITNGNTTYVNNVRVTSTFGYPTSFNGILARSVAAMGMDNIKFKTPAVAGFVAAPTSEITGASGTSRKFTLSCLTDGATIYYATSDLEKDAAGWTEYTSEVTTDATTIYAYAKKGSDTSEKINFATGAGSIVNLANATVTHSGNGQYTIANSQSSVLGVPTATVHYQIDGGAEQTSTSTSLVINIVADGTLTYWLTADGYGSTNPANETVYAAVDYTITRTIDFCTSNSNAWAVKGDEATVTGDLHTYYIYKDQSSNAVADDILATTFENDDASWRIQRYYGGSATYAKTEYIALKNLNAGQIVQFACSWAPSIVANLTDVPASTYTGTYTYTATTTGDVIVSLGQGVVISKIYLCETTISKTLAASGWSTLATPYGLNFSGVDGLTAFVVSSISADAVTLTSVDEMPANSGVILKGTASTAYSIPTKADAAFDGTNKLHAAVTAYDCAANEVYIMQGGQFHLVTAASTVPAGKAYLLAEDVPAAVKSLGVIFDEETTAIEGVESRAALNGQFYNLAGQRVNAPTRGIYIVNGKKVYVK